MSVRSGATALDRLERVLVMVPWLLDHPGATFDEIAERFDTTAEAVAADLDILGYCGLPGYGGGDLVEVTTFGDAVTVRMADFFTRPLRLSLREALTMLLAARSLSQVEGLRESEPLTRAAARLETLIGASATLGEMPVRVALDVTAEGDEYLAPLREAIAARRVVRLTYRSASKEETTTREVEPWSLVGAGGAWYLRGYCRLAEGHRDFRLDRIAHLEVLSAIAAERPQNLEDPPRYVPDDSHLQVELEVERRAWWVIDDLVADEVTEEGEWRRVRLRASGLEWIARRILPLGGAVRVCRPDALRARVLSLASDLRERYAAGSEESTAAS